MFAHLALLVVLVAVVLPAGFGLMVTPIDHPRRQLPAYDVGLRKRPLVAGIGFGHTATTSLAAGLRSLTLRTKHWAPETRNLLLLRLNNGMPPPSPGGHEHTSVESVGVSEFLAAVGGGADTSWQGRIAEANQHFEWGWDLLNETDAILDEPVNLFWRHIYQRFPDTRFVLTLRDTADWAESEYRWYNHSEGGHMNPVLPKDWMYWGWCNKAFNTSCASKFFEYSFGTSQPTKADLNRAYEQHVRDVRATIPKDQLLEMRISEGDGYQKLASFLDLPMPRDRAGRLKAFPSYCNGECVHGDTPARAEED